MARKSLLTIIARIPPEAWDAIIPHGPRVGGRIAEVALNPQPLPPKDMVVRAAIMAHDIGRLAIEQNAMGQGSAGWVSELIDDWCGTPWPKKWPWPWPGPRPTGPLPDPWDIASARVVGAVIFADLGSRLGDGELADAFARGAEQLAEAALNG